MIELQNIVAILSAKVISLENNHAQTEKENLDLKTLVKRLNHSLTLQEYESRLLSEKLASMESVSQKTNNDVINLTKMTLDMKQTLGENMGRMDKIDRVMKAQLRSSAVSSIDMERRTEEMNSSMMLLNTTLLNLQKGRYIVRSLYCLHY
jgi:hypothetical protein